jgi:3D (Asp-Asp-Asp) domain-containing protein
MTTRYLCPREWYKALMLLLAVALCLINSVGASAQNQVGDAQEKNQETVKSKKDEPSAGVQRVEPEPFVATAYSQSGRTPSGVPVRRGLISADPSVLPLGTLVRVEAGSFSGEYIVADTGGAVKGRRIDIWTPTTTEALRFGRRAVKLSVLSFSTPYSLKRDLEQRYAERKISPVQYRTESTKIEADADRFYKDVAHENLKNPKFLNAAYNPINFDSAPGDEKSFIDTYYERTRLEIDLARKVISQPERDKKLTVILAEEIRIIRKGVYTSAEVAHYYQKTEEIPSIIGLLTQNETSLTLPETVVRWAAIVVSLMGLVVTFYLGRRKDRREMHGLQMEQMKVEELKLRIEGLEKKVSSPERRLIVP